MASNRIAWIAALLAGGLAAPAAASTTDVVNAIAAYDAANLTTLGAINDAMVKPGPVDVAALKPQLSSGTYAKRWAATYVAQAMATDPGDLRALRPRLHDRDASIRALAGFGTAGNGVRAGLAALVALVPSDQLMVQGDGEPL